MLFRHTHTLMNARTLCLEQLGIKSPTFQLVDDADAVQPGVEVNPTVAFVLFFFFFYHNTHAVVRFDKFPPVCRFFFKKLQFDCSVS